MLHTTKLCTLQRMIERPRVIVCIQFSIWISFPFKHTSNRNELSILFSILYNFPIEKWKADELKRLIHQWKLTPCMSVVWCSTSVTRQTDITICISVPTLDYYFDVIANESHIFFLLVCVALLSISLRIFVFYCSVHIESCSWY